MVYMRVVSRSNSILHLARSPGLRSWATFMGIVSIGIGLLIYSNEGMVMKLFWFLCTLFVAVSSLDDWEECIIDRNSLIIRLDRERLMERLLRPFQKARSVVADVSEVCSVMVEHDDIKFFGRGYYVTLQMNTGMVLPITEKCTLGDSREHQQIADVIDDFLKPEFIKNQDFNNGLVGDYSSSSSSSDMDAP